MFGIRVANWASERCKEGVPMSQGQTGEILLPSPGKLGPFLILGLFSTRPSQKLGAPTHLKTTFSNRYGTGLSSQKDRLDKLKTTVLTGNCK